MNLDKKIASTPFGRSDPNPKPDNDLLDQAVAFAEMWGTEQNWPQVRDAYVAAILRERKRMVDLIEARDPFGDRFSQRDLDTLRGRKRDFVAEETPTPEELGFYNPAYTHGEIGTDEAAARAARLEMEGYRMRPDGSYFKPGS